MPSQEPVYAPDFPLDVANGPALVLSELWREHHLLLWFSRGLACPFCRRQIVQFGEIQDDLKKSNVAVVQITSTELQTARAMLQFFPVPWPYACDPEGKIVAAYDLHTAKGLFAGLAGEFAEQLNTWRIMTQHPAEPHPEVLPAVAAAGPILTREGGMVLIDRSGQVRLTFPTGNLSPLPANDPILQAVRQVTSNT